MHNFSKDPLNDDVQNCCHGFHNPHFILHLEDVLLWYLLPFLGLSQSSQIIDMEKYKDISIKRNLRQMTIEELVSTQTPLLNYFLGINFTAC